MEIIVVRGTTHRSRRLHIGRWGTRLLVVTALAAGAGLFWGGYRLAPVAVDPRPDIYAAAVSQEVASQRQRVDTAIRATEDNLNALALRVGGLQAHVIRLDALGERLVDVAKLDADEFNFQSPPGVGGRAPADESGVHRVPDFLADLRSLSADLQDREEKLQAVQGTLISRRLSDAARPRGRPVIQGWLSSFFGTRIDPMTGERARHTGVDFAGKPGSNVVSVAAGVVSWSGRRPGFGYVVDVNHGGGYVTRYAHNAKNLVRAGETVRKGQPIALMGSTGRSTGTHVHFELLENGKPIDPLPFVRAAAD